MEDKVVRKDYGHKNYLNKFYDEIYKRYQKIPFIEPRPEVVEEVSLEEEADEGFLRKSGNFSNGLTMKKKATMSESFSKMKFYNNFRK
jgi:hypothetical protein